MTLTLGFIGVVASDVVVSLTSYRVLGITVLAGSDNTPYVEAKLGNSTVIAWDSIDITHGFDADCTVPTGGHHIILTFDMGGPGQVNRIYRDLMVARHHGHVEP